MLNVGERVVRHARKVERDGVDAAKVFAPAARRYTEQTAGPGGVTELVRSRVAARRLAIARGQPVRPGYSTTASPSPPSGLYEPPVDKTPRAGGQPGAGRVSVDRRPVANHPPTPARSSATGLEFQRTAPAAGDRRTPAAGNVFARTRRRTAVPPPTEQSVSAPSRARSATQEGVSAGVHQLFHMSARGRGGRASHRPFPAPPRAGPSGSGGVPHRLGAGGRSCGAVPPPRVEMTDRPVAPAAPPGDAPADAPAGIGRWGPFHRALGSLPTRPAGRRHVSRV